MLYFKHHINKFLHLLITGCLILLSSGHLFSQIFPVDTIMKNGERANRINLVYVSDGYQSSELNTFSTNTATINNELFSQTPFKEYKNFFNVFDVRVPSNESGAKHPGNAYDESTSNGQPVIDPDNYFQSTFDYAFIHRLLVPQNNSGVYNVLASNLPDYDQAFVVVNSPYYGGSGGAFATASTDASSAEVAIHEIGHSFAGLADEYWAGISYAAEKPNMTQDNNPSTNKWKDWIGINNVGIYPYGTAAPENTWYRPHQLCKMQYLGYPFCSVCTERFVDHIHELVNMIDTYSPTSTSFTLTNTNNVDFSITDILSIPSTITVNWYLNGSPTPFATNVNSVSVPFSSFVSGTNTVTVEVVDSTSLSKSFLPNAGYINSIKWNINTGNLPITLDYFRGRINNTNQGILEWQVSDVSELNSFTLEKSIDGKTFAGLANINCVKGIKNYSYTDPNLPAPFAYYRLKMTDKQGRNTLSSVIKLNNPVDKFNYKVYQDADAHRYHLNCLFSNPAAVQVSITNANGVVVLQKDFGNANTQIDYDFNLFGKASGIYFLNLYIDGRKYNVKLVAK